jgi:hypothetical protein
VEFYELRWWEATAAAAADESMRAAKEARRSILDIDDQSFLEWAFFWALPGRRRSFCLFVCLPLAGGHSNYLAQ